MPLSEREQRMLDELERQLSADDPRLATQFGRSAGGVPVRRIVAGAAVAVAGLAVVLAGVSLQLVALGVMGTVVLGAGILLAVTGPRRSATAAPGAPGRTRPGADRPRSAFMQRLERDWDERRRREP